MKNILLYSLLFIVVLLLTSVFFTISPAMYKNVKNKHKQLDKVLLIGHRGAAGLAPENTIPSIDSAFTYDVDRVEVDIFQSKDNRVIVCHDETIDRTTDGKGLIKDYTFSELQEFDAGIWFSDDFKGTKLPSLDESFAAVDSKADFIIELKDGSPEYPDIEKNTLDLIHKYKATEWSIIHSFDDIILEKLLELKADVPVHKLFSIKIAILPIMLDKKWHFGTIGNYDKYEEISVYYKFVTPWMINKVHKMGKPINVWTVNDPKIAKRLLNMGVDGIITNCPDLMKPIIDDFNKNIVK